MTLTLRIPDSYDAKKLIAKIYKSACIQLTDHLYIYGALGKKAFCRILKKWFID